MGYFDNPTSFESALQQAMQGQPSDQLIKSLNKMGLPLNQQTESFLESELDMETTTGRTGLLDGFYLPKGDSRHDFFALESMAEQYASITGWRYFPTAVQLQWGVEHGVLSEGQDAIYRWFAGMAGTDKTMPWASMGLSKQSYDQQLGSYQDVVNELAGDPNAAADMVQRAMTNRWSSSKLRESLLHDQGFSSAHPYTQWGYTYDSWQQYKKSTRQDVVNRFGQGADTSDANYIQMLANPVQRIQSSGGAVRQDQQAQQRQNVGASAIR